MNGLFRILSFPIFYILFFSCAFSQNSSPLIDSLSNEANRLSYANKYDSAQSVILNFLERKNLSALEFFYGNYFLGDILKSSGKTNDAIKQFEKSGEYLKNISGKEKYESMINSKIAETYFSVSDYSNAKKFARQSIGLNPDSGLRKERHAVNYMILGYVEYTEKKFQSALNFYDNAIHEYVKANEPCELPLCYMKIAKVHNAMKNLNLAEANIEKANSLSDSCRIKNYKLLSLYTVLDIYKENKNYEGALKTLEEINMLVEEIGFEKQRQLMGEQEIKYQTRLAQSENRSLIEINIKNEQILSQQKQVLGIAIAAIFILSILVFFIIKISNQRKSALIEIEKSNQQIESQNQELLRLHLLNQKIFSVIAHDCRGPIISLQILLESLKEKHLSEESKSAQDISNQLIQANYIFDNLLNWAKAELGSKYGRTISAQPFLVAEEILLQLKSPAEKKKIRIVNHIETGLWVKIPEDILKIVFRNLISNAIKFSHENSDVILKYDNGKNLLRVIDSGIGMEEDKMKQLFSQNVFPSLGTWKETGFGLGLYMVYELLHRFQGNISIEKNSPVGTIFNINVPIGE